MTGTERTRSSRVPGGATRELGWGPRDIARALFRLCIVPFSSCAGGGGSLVGRVAVPKCVLIDRSRQVPRAIARFLR